jgi:altronate dehydratase small subunit
MWDAVRIASDDHVAVAVRDLTGTVKVLADDKLIQCVLPSAIPMGHKFALTEIPAGTEIRKYGQVIGVLTLPVNVGEHVHIHNLASLRGRRADR